MIWQRRNQSVSTRHDLGVEMSLHSTLNCYLEKLLFLLTGNFAREGCNNLHVQFAPVIGHSPDIHDAKNKRTKVTQTSEISRMYPPNVFPKEVLTDHPERIRVLIVDSGNPVATSADSQAMREAFGQLGLSVVIDVAMTETAELADYILPAQTQFEKSEASFFTYTWPETYFHLRKPLLAPEGNTLPEPEIYQRLLVAMGVIPESFPELEALAHEYVKDPASGQFAMMFQMTLMQKPEWRHLAPAILYATLGKALPPEKKSGAALWGAAQFYAQRHPKQVMAAGYEGDGHMLGENLFRAILDAGTSVPISVHGYEDSWSMIRNPDNKVHLFIPEMAEEMAALSSESNDVSEAFPLILAAGERREYNANQIYRTPEWRRNDPDGALRISPVDAEAVGVTDGGKAMCASMRGSIEVVVMIDPAQRPGFVSLPHGHGFTYPDLETEELVQHGPRVNELTSSDWCDPIAKTPYHKYVPVRVTA
ncbi:MAG: molybdopterin dinucleotide binding domain-containing protein [Chloroflexota bacterium]